MPACRSASASAYRGPAWSCPRLWLRCLAGAMAIGNRAAPIRLTPVRCGSMVPGSPGRTTTAGGAAIRGSGGMAAGTGTAAAAGPAGTATPAGIGATADGTAEFQRCRISTQCVFRPRRFVAGAGALSGKSLARRRPEGSRCRTLPASRGFRVG